MRIFHELIADEWLAPNDSATFRATKFFWEPVIGTFENMKVMVVADRVSGAGPTFSMVWWESPDIALRTSGIIIPSTLLTVGQTNTLTASLNDGIPLAYAVGFNWSLGGGTPSAHIRIWLTGRGRA